MRGEGDQDIRLGTTSPPPPCRLNVPTWKVVCRGSCKNSPFGAHGCAGIPVCATLVRRSRLHWPQPARCALSSVAPWSCPAPVPGSRFSGRKEPRPVGPARPRDHDNTPTAGPAASLAGTARGPSLSAALSLGVCVCLSRRSARPGISQRASGRRALYWDGGPVLQPNVPSSFRTPPSSSCMMRCGGRDSAAGQAGPWRGMAPVDTTWHQASRSVVPDSSPFGASHPCAPASPPRPQHTLQRRHPEFICE